MINIGGQNIYELAGPKDLFLIKNFYNHISNFLNKTRVLVPVPMALNESL